MATNSILQNLQSEYETIHKSLKDVDENIKKLTGRDPDDFRNPPTGPRRFQGNVENRPRIQQWNNNNTNNSSNNGFGEGGNFPRRRFLQGGNFPFPKRLRVDMPPREESPEDDELPNKPNVPSTVVATGRHTKTRKDTIEQQKRDVGFERNRRMFGLILGTLQQFQHEHSTSKEKLSKREEIEKKLDEAAEKERQEIRKERQELFIARREKRSKIRCLEHKLELVQMHDCWESARRKMQNYIQTSTQPPIFYIPSRHNSKTDKLLKESHQKIEEEMVQKRAELEAQLREIDQWYTKADPAMEEEMELTSVVKLEPPESPTTESAAPTYYQPHPYSATATDHAREEEPSTIQKLPPALPYTPPADNSHQPTDSSTVVAPTTTASEDGEKAVSTLADQEFEPIYDDE